MIGPPSPRAQRARTHRATAVGEPRIVDVEHPAPVLGALGVEGARSGDGAVDRDVDAAERRDRLVDQRAHRSLVAHRRSRNGDRRQRRRATQLCATRSRRGIDGGEDQPPTLARDLGRRGQAAGGTGDQRGALGSAATGFGSRSSSSTSATGRRRHLYRAGRPAAVAHRFPAARPLAAPAERTAWYAQVLVGRSDLATPRMLSPHAARWRLHDAGAAPRPARRDRCLRVGIQPVEVRLHLHHHPAGCVAASRCMPAQEVSTGWVLNGQALAPVERAGS